MAFVQQPGLRLRYPHQVHLVEDDPKRSDRAFQHRRVGLIKNKTLGFKEPARSFSLFPSLFGKIDVLPACKAIFLVPLALAVADQNQLVHYFPIFIDLTSSSKTAEQSSPPTSSTKLI